MSDQPMIDELLRQQLRSEKLTLIRPIEANGPNYNESETIYSGDLSGQVTIEAQTLHIASCGHLTDHPSQVAQCSQCEALSCVQCVVRCTRCLKLFCNAHVKWFKGKLFCVPCRRIVFSQVAALAFGRGTIKLISGPPKHPHRN